MTITFANAATRTVNIPGSALLYREFGEASGIPVIFLNHLTGVLDDWDPAVIDGIAEHHRVILFDNRGVGGSSGTTPSSIAAMASDAISFINALGLTTVDLIGFSMGGFIAQILAHDQPDLVRRVIFAGTGPAGGEGISGIADLLKNAIEQSSVEHRHPKQILFFSQTQNSQRAAAEFLQRLKIRHADRDLEVSNETIGAHLSAITGWGNNSDQGRPLGSIVRPVLVVNGDNDIMVPTTNSIALFSALPNAELSIFPDAGHGGIFQYNGEFVAQALRFLAKEQ